MMSDQTIIGLAQAVIIIEAGYCGGSLDAGRRALKSGIPVHVLSGAALPSSAVGNTLLIGEGANPLPVDPDLVLPAVGVPGPTTTDDQQSQETPPPQQLTLW